MTNKKFWMGILVMVLVFVMSGTAFAQSRGGTLTITGIPARFNGNYVVFEAQHSNILVLGYQAFEDINERIATGARISNGEVTIPLWFRNRTGREGGEFDRYTGNHTFETTNPFNPTKAIFFKTPSTRNDDNAIGQITFGSIKFSNGSATVSFQDTDGFMEY